MSTRQYKITSTKGTPKLTLAKVNKAIAKKYPGIRLTKGEGYYYLTSDDEQLGLKLAGAYTTSIYVYTIAEYPLDRWMEDVDGIMKSIEERDEEDLIW